MKDERTLQEAARRVAQLQDSHCADESRDDTRAWRERDPGNRRAAELAERVLAGVDQIAAHDELGRKLRALADQAFATYAPERQSARPRRAFQWKLGTGLAAAVAVAAGVWQLSSVAGQQQVETVAYETPAHQRRSVTLSDGSVIELDVGTRVAVRMSSKRREVELLEGRALFDVAHDSGRPFSVSANGSRTTALGTQFQVQRESQRVVVTLAEGSVAVDDAATQSAAARWEERLRPGEQLDIDSATAQRSRYIVDTQLVTSWTHGRHVFRGTPLHEALDEVNRYAVRKVRLGDPSLADMPVAGNFVAGDSDVVVDAFAAVLPLRVVRTGESEILLFRRYGQ